MEKNEDEDGGTDVLDMLLAHMEADGADDIPGKPDKPVLEPQAQLSDHRRQLLEVDLFSSEMLGVDSAKTVLPTSSHELFGDDSDGENDFQEKKFLNESGHEISRLMTARKSIMSTGVSDEQSTCNKWNKTGRVAHPVNMDKFLKEPLFDMKIVNPKVSMSWLERAADGKEKVQLAFVSNYQVKLEKTGVNWITAGVIASKSETKKSKADKEFIIMRLVDMSKVDSESSLFLFGKSYDTHWKLPVGTVIGLLNASFLKNDNKTNPRNASTLSICEPTQLLVVGTSKDFGSCTSITKAGNKCQNFVNRSICEKCSYHAMQEHKQASHKRPELNLAFGNKAPRVSDRLMAALASNSSKSGELIMYGGKSYTTKASNTKVSLAGIINPVTQKGHIKGTLDMYHIKPEDQGKITAAKTTQQSNAEKQLIDLISRPTNGSLQFVKHLVDKETKVKASAAEPKFQSITAAELIKKQKLELLQRMTERKKAASVALHQNVLLDLPAASISNSVMTPEEYRKMKAKRILDASGGIHKEDVNSLKKRLTAGQKEQVKRRLETSTGDSDKSFEAVEVKKPKLDINSLEFQALRAAKSKHIALAQHVENEKEDQYFGQLEKKESYEQKLLDTHAIDQPRFICKQCKYTDWKLADRCKQERHEWTRIAAKKRFFKCLNCNERTVSHQRLPTSACKKCGAMNYEKAGMIREKKVVLPGTELSLRGTEETFLGGFSGKVNLDLM